MFDKKVIIKYSKSQFLRHCNFIDWLLDPMISYQLVKRSNYAQGYISNIKEIANEPCGNERLTLNENKYPHKTNIYDLPKRKKEDGKREKRKTY